jgi:cell wall-associated NlpC family hydrolase
VVALKKPKEDAVYRAIVTWRHTYLKAMGTLLGQQPLRTVLARLFAAGLLFLATMAAIAGPDESADPVEILLKEKGLIAVESVLAPALQVTAPVMRPTVQPTTESPIQPTSKPTASLGQRVRGGAPDTIITAMNFLGVPYRPGGTNSQMGFDCSGFTRHVFEQSQGIVLPRLADDQANSAGMERVGRNEVMPGDLVFFNTLSRTFSHVGIYVGEGRFIHSPRTGAYVRMDDMRQDYWSRRFTGARRVQGARRDPNPEPTFVLQDFASDLYAH